MMYGYNGNAISNNDIDKEQHYIFSILASIYSVRIEYIKTIFKNTFNRTFSKKSINHLEPLTRDGDSISGDGIKYKIRITEHLNNLIIRDSTNAKLGLVVTSNVGSIQNFSILNSGEETRDYPSGAILSHKGTVLHGSQSDNLDKRPKIKIYYTDPDE